MIWHLGDLDTLGNNSYFNEHPTFNHQHTPILLDNGNHTLLVPFNDEDYQPDIVMFKIINWINRRI